VFKKWVPFSSLSLYLPHCINFPVRAVADLLRFTGFRDLIWVVNQIESCISFQYLSREYLFTNFGGVFWELWLLEVCCQLWLVSEFSNAFNLGGRLRLLRGRTCLRLYGRCCSMFLYLSIEWSYVFVRWVELELCPSEEWCPVLVLCFLINSCSTCSRSFWRTLHA
jgi:hypothetical protein